MFFLRKKNLKLKPLVSDFHSHLIPQVDDGIQDVPSAVEIAESLKKLGVQTIITTPHISQHAYPNTAETIMAGYSQIREALKIHDPNLDFFVAAEYYMDEIFLISIQQKAPLLTFGQRHLLFETSYLSEPLQLNEVIFQLVTQGYRPMLAHPERYMYMTVRKAEDLRNRGVNLQLNLLSLIGFYAEPVQRLAEKLIDAGLINAVSSDCHNPEQARYLEKVSTRKYYRRVLDLPLINFNITA